MKKVDLPSKIRFLSLVMVALIIMVSCHVYHNHYTYESIKVVAVENAAIEYGSANYDINDLVKKVDGDIVSVKKKANTSKVGKQEIIVEVEKDNVIKEVPIVVSVVDTVAPVINLKEDKITLTKGDDYDLTNNVDSVSDAVDGAISYLNEVNDDSNLYYNFSYNQDEIDEVGTHEVTVNAKDKYGNVSTATFTIEVVEPVIETPSYVGGQTYGYAAPNAYGSDVVSIAYSLVGSPYVGGSAGPYAFDCSGLVYYVYSRVGVYVSRSSWSQAYDGVGVSYADAQPGDILNWGHNGQVTHSALYVGGGMMIHATNPSQGVVLSNVAAWESGSYDSLMGVRRVQ